MFIELTTGHDSFVAKRGSARRNVSVATFAAVHSVNAKNEDVCEVVPLFAAYREKRKGFKETSLIRTIPATNMFADTDAGQWFVNRHEVKPGTEILIEYKRRDGSGGFGESTEHMLIIPDEDAPLWFVRLDLPDHPYSCVPNITFEGRFHIVSEPEELNAKLLTAWQKKLGISEDDDFHVVDLLDVNQETSAFYVDKREDGAVKKMQAKTVVGKDGRDRVKIRRTRRIKS